jgi:hypothetical protein
MIPLLVSTVKRDALKFLSFFPCSMTQGVALGQVGFDFLNKQTEILSAFDNVAD